MMSTRINAIVDVIQGGPSIGKQDWGKGRRRMLDGDRRGCWDSREKESSQLTSRGTSQPGVDHIQGFWR